MHLSPSFSTFGTEAGSPTEPRAHWFCYSSSLACSRDPISTSIPGSLGGMGLGRIQTPILRHVTSALPTESLEKNFLLVRHRDVGVALCLWHNFMNAELTRFHCSSHWKLFGDIHPADCDWLPQPVRRSLFIS